MERAAEVLYGVIMSLSFICSISIANAHKVAVRELLVGAIGCNLAWGLVDGTMYIIGVQARKRRSKRLLDLVRSTEERAKTRKYIIDVFPPVVASVMETEMVDRLGIKLKDLDESAGSVRLRGRELKQGMVLFLLVSISTFPIVIPFLFMHDALVALRVSSAIAITIMFFCGWSVARFSGLNKWKMSIAVALIGGLLVAITTLLGG